MQLTTKSNNLLTPALAMAGALLLSMAAHAAADVDPGEVIAYSCLGCHGVEGYRNAYPSYRVPKLGGQKRTYIENALLAYRDGHRKHPTMIAQGSAMTDADINDVAAWLQGNDAASDVSTSESGNAPAAAATCFQCHSADAPETSPTPPILSGQYQDYMTNALQQYKTGDRSGTVMSAFAATLDDEDIAVITQFFAAQNGLQTPTIDD